MKKIDIHFVNDTSNTKNYPILTTTENSTKLYINIFNLSIYNLKKELNKINNVIAINENNVLKIKRINVIFDKTIDTQTINMILGKLNDVLYSYYPTTKEIMLYQVNESSLNYMLELFKYKDIVMDPNKNPNTYLEYVKQNVPQDYNLKILNVNESNDFPLTKAVGAGSIYPTYFVQISPKKINSKSKNIFLIGKAVTFDSGGLNLKTKKMEHMKVDMTGSAMVLSILRLLNMNKQDTKFNIHLIMPIVENMIGNVATKPGSVIKSSSGKLVEIVNTDAEGRLCLADCLEYVQYKLIKNLDPKKCLMIDIATLTGNTTMITSGHSCLSMCNNKGLLYLDDIINIGENIGEYVDFLKIREEYMDSLTSPVADIANISNNEKAGCVIGGTFLNYFVNSEVPWIHFDVAAWSFSESKHKQKSYGINLIYEFITRLAKKID